jgi:hypothetical protein
MEPLRNALFAMEGAARRDDAFLKLLQSELRVYGDLAFMAGAEDGKVRLLWRTVELVPRMFVLASAYPLEVLAGENVLLDGAEQALGFTVVRVTPVKEGLCEIVIRPPAWANPLPASAELPRYDEPVRSSLGAASNRDGLLALLAVRGLL